MVLFAENFDATGVCVDAKETCNNWFCRVGSVMELLPRMYSPDSSANYVIQRQTRNYPAASVSSSVILIKLDIWLQFNISCTDINCLE